MADNHSEMHGWYNTYQLTAEACAALDEYFDKNPDEEKKLPAQLSNHDKKDEVYIFISNVYSDVRNYAELPPNQYGEGGTYRHISALIAHSIAEKHNPKPKFYDPSHNWYTPAEVPNLGKDNIAFLAPLPMFETSKDSGPNDERLKKVIENAKDCNKVIVPIAMHAKDSEGKEVGHMVSLIFDPKNKKAMLIDQAGKTDATYEETKKLIRDAFSGYSWTEPADKIVANRNDCALFAAMVNEQALDKDFDELGKYVEGLKNKPDNEVQQEVDSFNAQAKDGALSSYYVVEAQNPLFQTYLKAINKTPEEFQNMSLEEKSKLFEGFVEHGVIHVNENQNEDNRPVDPTWKEEVRAAVTKASNDIHTGFKEYTDEEHPELLCFKSNDKNRMVFSSRNNVQVEGEQSTFDTLVLSAKNMNMTKVNFGDFEQHPEYKARLFLACLKHGLEPIGNNVPSEEFLKQYPEEYAQIQAERKKQEEEKKKQEEEKKKAEIAAKRAELEKNLSEANGKLSVTLEAFQNDPTCSSLIEKYKKEKKKLKNATDDEKKTINGAIDQIKSDILETDIGKELNSLLTTKSTLIKGALDEKVMTQEEVNLYGQADSIFKQKREGESDEDFKARKEKHDKHWADMKKSNDPQDKKTVEMEEKAMFRLRVERFMKDTMIRK